LAGTAPIAVNSLPLRAYNLIYNQWFRDENNINGVTVRTGDTGDVLTDYTLLKRAKSADYFTTALPWPQKFSAPSLGLQNAPVQGIGIFAGSPTFGPSSVQFYETDGTARTYEYWSDAFDVNSPFSMKTAPSGPGGQVTPQVYADMSAVGLTVNVLRQAFLTQQLLERDARGGTRYTEIVKSHFGVTSPDMRLQRPEYCGGGSSPFNITPVAQTAPSSGNIPVGNLGAAGTSVGQHRASYAATEHGYILGFINVKSELSYQQGLNKLWSRSTRYDFYWPSLAGLGEQAVLRKEIYATGVAADDNTVFGYQERWHEYRTHVSEVTGQFRSTTAGTLDAWHLAQRFTSAPVLGQSFIEDKTDDILDRVLAAGASARTTSQQYLADILINREAVRPLPVFGTPVTLGRF